MASRAGVSRVKAGYWFCGPNHLIRPLTDFPFQLFTHLYAGFAEVNSDGSVTIPGTYSNRFQDFTKTVQQRSNNRPVKTLLSIGGEGSDTSLVAMAMDPIKRATFIRTSISVARRFGFDGLDLCWLNPLHPTTGFNNVHLQSWLQSLLGEWRQAVLNNDEGDRLLLTAAVFHHPVIPGRDGGDNFSYPCTAIKEKLDWINVLAIDFYTPSNSPQQTGPVHAWLNQSEPNRCGRSGIQDWINAGVPAKKLVLCLPFYGYAWNLTNPTAENGLFAQAYTAHKYYKNIKALVDKRSTKYDNGPNNENYVASYVYNERSWIGYDDEWCVRTKVSNAVARNQWQDNANLRGCFAWHLGADDETWSLSEAAFGSGANWPPGDL